MVFSGFPCACFKYSALADGTVMGGVIDLCRPGSAGGWRSCDGSIGGPANELIGRTPGIEGIGGNGIKGNGAGALPISNWGFIGGIRGC